MSTGAVSWMLGAAAIVVATAQSCTAQDREQQAWQRIQALSVALAAPAGDQLDRFEQQRNGRETLVERLREYRTLFPGGAHLEEAVRLELSTHFELAALRGGDYARLCALANELGGAEGPHAIRAEAAYWSILCERFARVAAASMPASAPLTRYDPQSLEAFADYIARFPEAWRTPQLTGVLFDAALAENDLPRAEQLLADLNAKFSAHVVTRRLQATIRRVRAVGKPLPLVLPTTAGGEFRTTDHTGTIVAIVVWRYGIDTDFVRSVDEALAERGARGVGIALDASEDEARALPQTRGVEWPVVSDERGTASAFVMDWGLDAAPGLMLLDRAGRLVGVFDPDGWAAALERVAGE